MKSLRTLASPAALGLVGLLALLWAPMAAHAQDGADDGLVLLAGAGGALLAAWATDDHLHRELHRPPGGPLDGLVDFGTRVGKPMWFLSGLGGLYLGGELLDESELSEGAVHALAALIASGVVNGSLKFTLGRCRPDASLDCDARDFRGLEVEDHLQSFPSGHAVVAYSLATTLAHKTESTWVGALGYGAASVVGWSRIHRGRHWVSDVLGGAIVGVAMSRLTLDWLDDRGENDDERIRFGLVSGGLGVRVPVR
ncbi:MAG: phosphatase PAP2 family protein [Longimicrobiales bacterium]